MSIYLDNKKHLLEIYLNKIKLVSPLNLIQNNLNTLKEMKVRLNNIIEKKLDKERNNLDYLINTLKLVNPLNI